MSKNKKKLKRITLGKKYSLFNTKLRVLQADWLVLENNEKATLNIHMSNSEWYLSVTLTF